MGNCGGSEKQEARTKRIDEQLKSQRPKLDNEIKILLLGAGDSGKSTVMKQMKIIHGKGFTDTEKKEFIDAIYENLIINAKALVHAVSRFGLEFLEENEQKVSRFEKLAPHASSFSSEIAQDMMDLWKDPAIKSAYTRSSEFQLNNSAEYFFGRIPDIISSGYVPSVDDILRVRIKTTGINVSRFEVDSVEFQMVDVGGQRNERKKWIHCFQNVTSAIFCVGTSEYDQGLYEDQSENRMIEALNLFAEICNCKWFENTEMILFFNKDDLFREKIKTVSLKTCFDDYDQGLDYEEAKTFLTRKFKSVCNNQSKRIYEHFTTATNTKNIEYVFSDIKDILLSNIKHI
ncbi:g protein alpha i subunit [Anaeramoeba ignava]|uniref:G protein alpha i subunit n=1 Tax=Anaeramoeba ignava TaxID=1746090 RepID=A0A9Q0LCP2_ANAIG|nr:g protein alpha i subunit [Anaeramoeba ignava]